MKKIAIGSWAYTFGPYEQKPVGLKATIEEVSNIGFDGISLGGFKPHAHPDLYKDESSIAKLKDLIKLNALEVVEYSPDVNVYNPITQQDEYLERYTKFIKFMKKCDFNLVRLDSGCPPIVPESLSYSEAKKRIVSVFKKATKIAENEGMKVVWEFEPGFIFNKPDEVVEICEKVNEDAFSVLFDMCHAYMCGVIGARQIGKKQVLKRGIVEFMEKLSGKIGLVHLIDSDGTLHDNDTSTHAPFGMGNINFDEVIPALEKVGRYNGDWWVIDLCFWPDAWNVTRQCKQFIDNLNKKYEV